MNYLNKIVLFVCIVLAVVLLVFVLRDVYVFGVDDSFIFFRYAENLANGHGFVFNAGEPSGEGFTSWIWLLLLTFFHYVGLDVILISKILGIVFHVLGGIFLFCLAIKVLGREPLSKLTALLLTGSFLLNYRLAAHSVSGMETSLYVFSIILLAYLTTAALYAPVPETRWWLIISIAALGTFLVRPEGIAAGGISLFALAIRQRENILDRNVWLYILFGLILPLGLFIALKILIFGYPLPHSYYHKLIVIKTEYSDSFRHLLKFIKSYWWLLAAAGVSMLCFLPARIYKDKKSPFVYLTFFFLVMAASYLLFYPVMNYLHRFYIPYLPLLLVMILPLLYFLVEKINRFWSEPLRILGLVIVAALLIVGMNTGLESSRRNVKSWSNMVNPGVYRAKLGKLMSHLPSGVVVANTEMGVIPYYSRLECIDMAGLTDPYIAHNGLTMEYLTGRKVDLILFNKDVRKISTAEWNKYTLNYKNVFLSERFKRDFDFIGFCAAWPGGKKGYYIYADKTSRNFPALLQWYEKYIGYFQPL